MPDLTIEVQEVPGHQGTALVVLNGSIDAKTVITFQTHLNSVRGKGINRFILDLENVKYVNSTGLGYLINLSDSVGSDEGAISLVKVQPKVKVVFDMLGLNAFFKIYYNREEAIATLGGAPDSSETQEQKTVMVPPGPKPRDPAEKPSPAPVRTPAAAQAPAAPSSQAVTPSPVVSQPKSSQLLRPVRPRSSQSLRSVGSQASVQVDCQSCRVLLSVRDVGTYKCPRCMTFFNYVGNGKTSFLPRRRAVPVQLSLSFNEECTAGFLGFVEVLGKRAGFSAELSERVAGAVKETIQTICQQAYGGNAGNIYHVLMHTHDSELEIRIADYGRSIPVEEARTTFFENARAVMDRFDLKNHPRGGNFVTLAKKVQ